MGFLLREVYAQLQQRVYDTVAAAGHDGLRALHSPVLRHLLPEGGRVADLARATGLAKQSVAYVVADLVALGYLQAEADPEDGRARRLVYTARGRELLAALVAASREAEAALALTLGRQRLAALRDTLEAVWSQPLPSARVRNSAAATGPHRR
ncbi:MAG: MarR family winged helix-turn-helix transcriptional regulator [Burkholderiaceae bacterium]|nr:MarR family winged helix-turn-helix transcriptional regulator [Burkholderiaceae bacterium]